LRERKILVHSHNRKKALEGTTKFYQPKIFACFHQIHVFFKLWARSDAAEFMRRASRARRRGSGVLNASQHTLSMCLLLTIFEFQQGNLSWQNACSTNQTFWIGFPFLTGSPFAINRVVVSTL